MTRPALAPVSSRARLDLLDPLEVSKLGGIEVVTEGVVEGFLTGLHRSPRRGFSVEFAEHRMYQPGDELRYVDWKILGRNDRLYVKQFEEETNLRAMLVCDASRSMAWTGAPETVLPKLAYAQRLLAALALILIRQRDATGLITFDDDRANHTRLTLERNNGERPNRTRSFPCAVDARVTRDHAGILPHLREAVLTHRADLRVLADRPAFRNPVALGHALDFAVIGRWVPAYERATRG
jgi:hypothetical protein